MNGKPEILAPCGGMAQLAAALGAGADAVYLGLGSSWNMRSAASANFDEKTLPEASRLARGRGVKVYLTLNTITFDRDERPLARILDLAAPHVDAVIASDWAVVGMCAERGLQWHASTQMSCSNTRAARFLAAAGARRIVLARECTLGETARIAAAMRAEGVEIEAFVHGAQCVAVSGRCFMSHEAYGASASLGRCQQPCRRPFRIVREEAAEGSTRAPAEFSVGPHAVFSARDLCSLPFLDKIVAAGVASLKIEGRARPPEYVSTVVGAYREAVDAICGGSYSAELAARLQERCATVYHRDFGPGLAMGRPGERQWAGDEENRATRVKRNVGVVQRDWPRAGAVQIMVHDREFAVGDELSIQGPATGDVRVKVSCIRHDDETWTRAKKGDWCTVPRPARVRPGDRVYVFAGRG